MTTLASSRTRLDRFLAQYGGVHRRGVRQLLAQGRVLVDGVVAREATQVVHRFSVIVLDGQVLQQHPRVYLMLHKPSGVVSATFDAEHPTVTSLLPAPQPPDLHLVGRLDRYSTGLLLLTNDGDWSRRLTDPAHKVVKVYEVQVAHPITPACVAAFAEGIHFPYENIITRPAILEILAPCVARVSLTEGRYHQIKRMFGRFRNPVLALHRLSIGDVSLDAGLQAGQSRPLTEAEVQSLSDYRSRAMASSSAAMSSVGSCSR